MLSRSTSPAVDRPSGRFRAGLILHYPARRSHLYPLMPWFSLSGEQSYFQDSTDAHTVMTGIHRSAATHRLGIGTLKFVQTRRDSGSYTQIKTTRIPVSPGSCAHYPGSTQLFFPQLAREPLSHSVCAAFLALVKKQ